MKTKFAIGCLAHWYEIEILSEYIDPLIAAIDRYGKENVHIDLTLCTNQELERIEEESKMLASLHDFYIQTTNLKGYDIHKVVTAKLIPTTTHKTTFT